MNNCKKNKEDITMKLKLIRKTRKAYAETCPGGSSPSLCKSQNITSTINKDHCVPADVKRPFEIVNGNRFGVLCQSLLDIAYDSSCRIKAGDIIPDPTTISRCASRRYAKSINC